MNGIQLVITIKNQILEKKCKNNDAVIVDSATIIAHIENMTEAELITLTQNTVQQAASTYNDYRQKEINLQIAASQKYLKQKTINNINRFNVFYLLFIIYYCAFVFLREGNTN